VLHTKLQINSGYCGSARVCDEGVGFKLQVRLHPLVSWTNDLVRHTKAVEQ
jgi:hypothetical protein